MPDTARAVLNRTAEFAVDCGDSREWVYSLPKESVQCCVTSPPYFGLRAYLPSDHPDKDKEIGTEKTPAQYVEELVDVFRGVRRALTPSGCLWLNLGDTYAAHPNQRKASDKPGAKQATNAGSVAVGSRAAVGYKAKDLIGIPWEVAFALRADGWYLRQWCPWIRRSSMPDSADDRPGVACETVFLLAKNEHYYFDMEAVKRPARYAHDRRAGHGRIAYGGKRNGDEGTGQESFVSVDDTRNFRNGDLWFDSVGMLLAGHIDGTDDDTLLGIDATAEGTKALHFAVMPKKLIRPLVLSGTSERGACPHCGAPWVRVTEKERVATRPGDDGKIVKARKDAALDKPGDPNYRGGHHHSGLAAMAGNRDPERHVTKTRTVGWEPSCPCANNGPVPCVVMDPFVGAGTVLMVARDRGRRAIGNDINKDYVDMARRRVGNVTPGIF